MTLHQLRIFECVVRHRNITKASAALHISQPSVSQQLRFLEEECGRRFLIRDNQGVKLTSEGEEFLSSIQPLLAQVDDIEKRFKNSPKINESAPLIVGGSHNLSVHVLPKLLMTLKERHPSVQFTLETDRSPVIEERLLAGELEIALITNPSHRAEIVYEPYEEIDVVAFCLPTNPLGGKKLTLKELVECPLVMRSGGRTDRILMNLGYKVNVALRCEVSSAVKAAVRLGMGVGLLYRNAVASRVARGNLRLINVPELKELGFNSFTIYDKRKALAPMAREFLQILREKRKLPTTAKDKKVQIDSVRTLITH